jgi:hypothetical protein
MTSWRRRLIALLATVALLGVAACERQDDGRSAPSASRDPEAPAGSIEIPPPIR